MKRMFFAVVLVLAFSSFAKAQYGYQQPLVAPYIQPVAPIYCATSVLRLPRQWRRVRFRWWLQLLLGARRLLRQLQPLCRGCPATGDLGHSIRADAATVDATAGATSAVGDSAWRSLTRPETESDHERDDEIDFDSPRLWVVGRHGRRTSIGASTQRGIGLLERSAAAADGPGRFARPTGLSGVPQ